MNIKITEKDLKATESIKEYVEKKSERLEKYFGEDFDVTVTIRAEKNMQISEISVNTNQGNFRAVTEHKDLYASIDKNIDILEGQIRKMKTKKDRQNKDESIKDSFVVEKETEIENEILKTAYYEIKPMAPEDAKLILQERRDLFYTFINIDTNKVNVIFRLKDGKNFGIVEPEA